MCGLSIDSGFFSDLYCDFVIYGPRHKELARKCLKLWFGYS